MAGNTEEILTISGMAEDVIYKNPQNGYTVITMDIDGYPVTATGNFGDVTEGESLVLRGNYIMSQKYGRQFQAVSCERKLPSTKTEITRYLGSGIFKGIGPAMAKKIVTAYGEDTLDIIENDPIKLSQINGISPEKAEQIGNEFRKLNGVRSIIEFLRKYKISPVTSSLVWNEYEAKSVSVVKNDPYILCRDDFGVDFAVADQIASDLSLSTRNKNRIIAGLSYILRQNAQEGHTCLPRSSLTEIAIQYINVDEDDIDKALFAGIEDGCFYIYETTKREYVYLKEFYLAETYVCRKILKMLKLSAPLEKDYSDDIGRIESEDEITYAPEQKAAINAALGNNLFILTGGPGTGKTTALNAVIKLFEKKKKHISLAAPTGRAAKRLSDLTGRPASTIHRLLEVEFSIDNSRPHFKHCESDPLDADVIIIDEMSMVDIQLFGAFMKAVRPECRLILVGDTNQLPSVGPGNVLRDLIASKLIPTIELKEIFRQAAESLIITNAHRIVNGDIPELDNRRKDFFFMQTESDSDIPELIVQLAQTRLPKAYGLSPVDDIQILAPTKIGIVGTKELNKTLQLTLNPPTTQKKEIRFVDMLFRTGDKVMQIKNDYSVVWKRGDNKGSGVFNGDIGKIYDIDTQNQLLFIDFDGRKCVYTSEMFYNLDLAYAVTIHKSQGSEYRAVILPLNLYSENLLFRNLLYTGVTRAKELLIVIGRREAVSRMVQNNKKSNRYSCFRTMLEENFDDT